MLDVPQAFKDALKGDYTKSHLVTLNLNGTTLYYTESGIPIEYQGVTYLNNGLIKDLGNVKTTSELRVNETQIQFSAADQSTIAIFLNNSQYNQEVTVDKVLLDDNFNIIGSPVRLSNWLVTGWKVRDKANGESLIGIKLANEFADWEKPAGRRTTPASQQRFYEGDKGFEFAASVQKEIEWGAGL